MTHIFIIHYISKEAFITIFRMKIKQKRVSTAGQRSPQNELLVNLSVNWYLGTWIWGRDSPFSELTSGSWYLNYFCANHIVYIKYLLIF